VSKFHDYLPLFRAVISGIIARQNKIEKSLKKSGHFQQICCSIALRERAVLCMFAKANYLRKRLAQQNLMLL